MVRGCTLRFAPAGSFIPPGTRLAHPIGLSELGEATATG